MDGQYSLADDIRPQLSMDSITPDHYPFIQRNLVPISSRDQQYHCTAAMLSHHEAAAASLAGAGAPPSSATTSEGYLEVEGTNGRWPRQETLSLLEIRSNLHSKFKQANHKAPLWDEVSSIMAEEHGYQRSGKKCREKFENMYKYYKKTKDGKAGRQDGKHYRFFKQLEALYGTDDQQQPTNPNNISHSLGDTNTFQFQKQTTRHCIDDDQVLVTHIKEFMDSHMRKLIEKQEEWLAKMMEAIDRRDRARVLKEEEWRKQDADRVEREYLFWAKEKAWIEARDASLMEALKRSGYLEINDRPNHHHFAANYGIQDSYFRFLMMGEGDNFWGSYGFNLNKQENK